MKSRNNLVFFSLFLLLISPRFLSFSELIFYAIENAGNKQPFISYLLFFVFTFFRLQKFLRTVFFSFSNTFNQLQIYSLCCLQLFMMNLLVTATRTMMRIKLKKKSTEGDSDSDNTNNQIQQKKEIVDSTATLIEQNFCKKLNSKSYFCFTKNFYFLLCRSPK